MSNKEPAPEASEKFELLKSLLQEMFQLDRGDLDFGLYRIMNLKAKEINNFLDHELLPEVKEVLSGVTNEERQNLEKSIRSATEMDKELMIDPATSRTIIKLKEQLAEAKVDAEAEGDVYDHLVNFFSRYYFEGDFISQRRYSNSNRPSYLIPYDGEEVKLHWASADQFYIKTTENYASYAFTVGQNETKHRVLFEIGKANSEKDNIKEASGNQRRFCLAGGKQAVEVNRGELIVRFEHRPLTQGEKKKYPGNGASQQARI